MTRLASSVLPFYQDLPDNAVLCLMSPTASGKTDFAYRLYDTGRFELISVDSALIYQGMDIGTAKPTKQELLSYPHHLVDIIKPTQSYSVADFVDQVAILIDEIHARGKLPLLVGGTMMYYMALFDGISSVPATQPKIRQQVKLLQQDQGNQALYDYLLRHDPEICQRLTVGDTQRISRAVEVHMQTGLPMTSWQNTPKIALSQDPKWHWYGLIVTPDRPWLHDRIAKRLDLMWSLGFVQEVIELIEAYPDLTADMPALRCVGYRQVLDYLLTIDHDCIKNHPKLSLLNQSAKDNGLILQNNNQQMSIITKKSAKTIPNLRDLACQDMKNKALYATRQLAKRQYTWLKQLALKNESTINNVTMASFGSIQQVQEQLLHQ